MRLRWLVLLMRREDGVQDWLVALTLLRLNCSGVDLVALVGKALQRRDVYPAELVT